MSYEFKTEEYSKYHRDSKKEYSDWLDKKAKKYRVRVDSIAD
jgi:hypothetical protein